jgi:hypothetical protein
MGSCLAGEVWLAVNEDSDGNPGQGEAWQLEMEL